MHTINRNSFFFYLFIFFFTRVVEKDQMILVLEQKVNALENQSNNRQHSPDLVVVTPRDLLGSEPMLTSESFEEVHAYKVSVCYLMLNTIELELP